MEQRELNEVHGEGMAINARAFGDGEVEVAYHALAMAMHAAQSKRDVEALSAIAAQAEEQARILGARSATAGEDTLLGSATASHARIFASLAQQAKKTAIRVCLPGRPRPPGR